MIKRKRYLYKLEFNGTRVQIERVIRKIHTSRWIQKVVLDPTKYKIVLSEATDMGREVIQNIESETGTKIMNKEVYDGRSNNRNARNGK